MAVHLWVLRLCATQDKRQGSVRRASESRARAADAAREKRLRLSGKHYDELCLWRRTRHALARAMFKKPEKEWTGLRDEVVREFAEAQKLRFAQQGRH